MKGYREKVHTLFILIVLACTACSFLVAVDRYANYRMAQFDQSSAEVTGQFMDLNAKVFEDIPPPEGAVLVRFENGPCDRFFCYDVFLTATYEVKNLSEEDVFKYYDRLLKAKNWKSVRGLPLYYRGTSCIHINRRSDGAYPIQIWHDFFNQSFSPKPPPSWILQYKTFGEYIYGQCPP